MPNTPPIAPDFEDLLSALCAVYRTPADLAFAVRVRLQINLFDIAAYYETLHNQVFQLIDWAESTRSSGGGAQLGG